MESPAADDNGRALGNNGAQDCTIGTHMPSGNASPRIRDPGPRIGRHNQRSRSAPGAEQRPLLCYIVFAGFQAGLTHANFGLNFEPLKYLLNTPHYHHWHHSSEREAVDTNYAIHLPLIDWLFGTYHMPPAHAAGSLAGFLWRDR